MTWKAEPGERTLQAFDIFVKNLLTLAVRPWHPLYTFYRETQLSS